MFGTILLNISSGVFLVFFSADAGNKNRAPDLYGIPKRSVVDVHNAPYYLHLLLEFLRMFQPNISVDLHKSIYEVSDSI